MKKIKIYNPLAANDVHIPIQGTRMIITGETCTNAAGCGGDPYDKFAPRFKGNCESKGPNGEIGFFQSNAVMDFDHTAPDPYLTFSFVPTAKNNKAGNNRVKLEQDYSSDGFFSSDAVSVESSVDDASLNYSGTGSQNWKQNDDFRKQDKGSSRIYAGNGLKSKITSRQDNTKPSDYAPHTAALLQNVSDQFQRNLKDKNGNKIIDDIRIEAINPNYDPWTDIWVAAMGVQVKPENQDLTIKIGTGSNVHEIKFRLKRQPQVTKDGELNSAWDVTCIKPNP